MTRNNAAISRNKAKTKQSVYSEAQKVLFQPGVQIRLAAAILLVSFAAVFPLVVLYYFYWLPIAFEIFVTVPLIYGLSVMARKAANREEILMRDLFAAFSSRYLRSLITTFWFVLFMGLPLFLPVGLVYGGISLYELICNNGTNTFFAFPVILLGIGLACLSLVIVFLLQMPAYLLISLRIKEPKISCFRALWRSFRLLTYGIFPYLKLRMQLLLLDLVSCISVCALFPLYTIPLYYCANAAFLDWLIEKERLKKERATYLTKENQHTTIKTED